MNALLHTHSLLRYVVMVLLIAVIIKSFSGWMGKKPFTKGDDKFSLFLFISTHLQLLIGLILYFISDRVQFTSETMKMKILRYWAVEHITGMLIAIVLITIARSSMKKLTDSTAKHKRLAILNTAALVVIMVILALSDRGIFSMSALQ